MVISFKPEYAFAFGNDHEGSLVAVVRVNVDNGCAGKLQRKVGITAWKTVTLIWWKYVKTSFDDVNFYKNNLEN